MNTKYTYEVYDKNQNKIATFYDEVIAQKYKTTIDNTVRIEKKEHQIKRIKDMWEEFDAEFIGSTTEPYLRYRRLDVVEMYNPNYGDNRMCKCGHAYARHFDLYESESAGTCKYCGCTKFEEAK
jgi:hypothetical protein